jgi:hypothetical protein
MSTHVIALSLISSAFAALLAAFLTRISRSVQHWDAKKKKFIQVQSSELRNKVTRDAIQYLLMVMAMGCFMYLPSVCAGLQLESSQRKRRQGLYLRAMPSTIAIS